MTSEQKEKIFYYLCTFICLIFVVSGSYYTHLLIAIQITDLIQQIKDMTTIPITILLCYGEF